MTASLLTGRGDDVGAELLAQARALMDRAFDDMTDDDWDHALGGTHALVVEDGVVLAHASVVRRTLWVGDRAVASGYVEAVATEPKRQGEGHGTTVMRAIGELIVQGHEIGCLGTGEHHFYERLGWQRWRGTTSVRRPGGDERTEDEDDSIMVLLHDRSPALDLDGPIACEERDGDDW